MDLAVAAALSCVEQGDLTTEQRERCALFLGAGPNLDMGRSVPNIRDGIIREQDLDALWLLGFLPNTAASIITTLASVHGESVTLTTACAAGLQAIGLGADAIRSGRTDLALAGAGDSRLSRGGLLGYTRARAVARGDSPGTACRPFDRSRSGFVPGEGGAFFLLEELGHARRRKATILGEILGNAATADGHALTAPDPRGIRGKQAVRTALVRSGLNPGDICAISAHGTGTRRNDTMEADMIARVFGPRTPPVVALKSWIGHLAAACGAVELDLLLTCLEGELLPPVRNLTRPEDSRPNYVRSPEPARKGPILLHSFGFGGQNATLVVTPWNG
jgi:3-oxoacyl-[acyl-carrier-protein] synthase II